MGEHESTEARIERLERAVERLEKLSEQIAAKLAIEAVPGSSPAAPHEQPTSVPAGFPDRPPVVVAPVPMGATSPSTPTVERVVPPVEPKAPQQSQVAPPPTETPAAKKEPSSLGVDTEFLIGRRLLPIAGAVVTILGFVFLVALGISRGWISANTQFAGELVLCTAFVGIGVWKVNEKDSFGQILVGVGLSGFYLSFAGAYAYKEIISGAALVLAFFVISLGSHIFSGWRSSKPFLFLGLVGSLAAAFMAWRDSSGVAHVGLIGLAAFPAWLLISRKQWAREGAFVWSTVTVATLPALLWAPVAAPAQALPILALFWTYALVGGHATLQAIQEKVPKTGALATLVLVLAATPLAMPWLAGGRILEPGWCAAAIFLFCGAVWLSSRLWLASEVKSNLAQAAIGACIVVCPAGLSVLPATVTYAVASVVLSLIVRQSRSTALAALSIIEVCLGFVAYLFWSLSNTQVELGLHLGILGLLAIAVACVGALSAPSSKEEAWSIPAALTILMLMIRAAYLVLPARGLLGALPFCWAVMIFGVATAMLAGHRRWRNLGLTAVLVSLLGSTVMGLSIAVHDAKPVSTETSYLLAFMAGGVLIARAQSFTWPDDVETVWWLTASVLWAALARLLWIFLVQYGFDGISAGVASMALASAAVGGVSIVRKSTSLAAVSATTVLAPAAAFSFLLDPEFAGKLWIRASELRADVLLAGCVIVAAASVSLRKRVYLEHTVCLAAAVLGAVITRLAYLVFVWPPFRLQNMFVMEVAVLSLGLVSAGVAHGRRWPLLARASAVNLFLALALYPTMKLPELGFVMPAVRVVTRGQDLLVLGGALLFSLFLFRVVLASGLQRRPVLHIASVVDWGLTAGFLMLVLDLPPLRLKFDASMSVSWIVYAAILLTIGFVRKVPVFRYWALTIFAATVVKVVVYDLAYLDIVVKVVILFLLGIVMMAGAYPYIKMQTARNADKPQA